MRYVELLNVRVIDRFIRKHGDAGRWLRTWIANVLQASWKDIQDVRRKYPGADGVPIRKDVVVTVFNVKGNEYRLLTIIGYVEQRVYVVDVLTHAEYDTDRWKDRI